MFIKTSKSHTEQVIDANFNIILNAMKNGDEYYVSDNGRIRRKIRDSNDHVDIVRYTNKAQRYNSNREHYGSHLHYDGVKPKQTQHYSQSVSHGNKNTDYVTTRDSTPPSAHHRYEGTYRRPDVYTRSNTVRSYSDSRTECGWLMITQTIAITLNSIWTVSSIKIITKDRTIPSPQLIYAKQIN